jgi:hypothetical protein
MENKKQTAVELLFEKYKSQNTLLFADDFTQALEMEKQQIIDAHTNGRRVYSNVTFLNESKQYYNETYGE